MKVGFGPRVAEGEDQYPSIDVLQSGKSDDTVRGDVTVEVKILKGVANPAKLVGVLLLLLLLLLSLVLWLLGLLMRVLTS